MISLVPETGYLSRQLVLSSPCTIYISSFIVRNSVEGAQ